MLRVMDEKACRPLLGTQSVDASSLLVSLETCSVLFQDSSPLPNLGSVC